MLTRGGGITMAFTWTIARMWPLSTVRLETTIKAFVCGIQKTSRWWGIMSRAILGMPFIYRIVKTPRFQEITS